MPDKKLSFDWTISLNTLVLLAGLIGAGAVAQWRLGEMEKNMASVQKQIERLTEQNNAAHMEIIKAAERVGTRLDEHVKYTVKQ